MNSRRHFLKSGMAASGLLMLGPVSWSIDTDYFGKDLLRIGIIGMGDRGSGMAKLFEKITGTEVVAVADPLPFRLKRGLALAKGAKGYENHEGLLDNKKVDAVIVCTPFNTHAEVVMAALQAGKHVYCEKTMVKGISDIQRVLDSYASHSKVVFQTGHQYHSSPLYNKVSQIIQSEYIGEVTAYECQWNRNGDWRRPVPDPAYERMINWRMYREYSGGVVAELMSHQIDFINWVTGSQPAKFAGFGGVEHWKDGRETFDNVHLLCEYPSGLDASFTSTTTNGYEDYQIKILGSKATIILDYRKASVYLEQKVKKDKGLVDGVSGATMKAWEQGKGAPIEADGNAPTLSALKEFYNSIVHGKPVVSDIRTGAQTAKCVQIALEALHEEKIKYWKDYPELRFG